jgi:hypothetical protein
LVGGITNGFVRDNVFVKVILNVAGVAFLKHQNLPPVAVDVLAGSVIALNAVFVK